MLQFLEALLLEKITENINAYRKELRIPLHLRKEALLDEFPYLCFVLNMAQCRDVFLLTSMELTLTPDCSVHYLDIIYMNSFKSIFLKKKKKLQL